MRVLLLAATFLLSVHVTPARAHPHGWIDMQSKLVFDDAGQIVAIEQAWLFDELYSAFMLDEIEMNGEAVETGLARLAQEDISALAEFDYFTKFEAGGKAQRFAPVTSFANGVADARIWLRFQLPLAQPVDPSGAVRYAVFDPTYYIELLHIGDAPVVLEGAGAERCDVTIVKPRPPAEIVSLAASLDMFAIADDGLGDHFAQWIELECADA